MIKFVIVLVTSTLVCQALVIKEPCRTSANQEGLCIKLQNCPSIYAMSTDHDTPMTLERLNFLIDSMCGYVDMSPKVCCPIEEATVAKVEDTTSDLQTVAPIREEVPAITGIEEGTTSSNEIR